MVVELFVEITPNSARLTNKNWRLINRERKRRTTTTCICHSGGSGII